MVHNYAVPKPLNNKFQGRRRLLKNGPAMKGQRRRSRVPKAREGGEHERGRNPLS